MAKDKSVKRGVYLYLDGKEIKNDVTSISSEIRKLTADIKKMQIGSEEYNRTAAKIKNLKGVLAVHRAEISNVTKETNKSTFSIGKFADGFNRFFGVLTAGAAALTGFVLGLRQIRDEKNKLEESQAGLKALTGLDDDSISWLTEQANKLSTTMTKEGLRVRQSSSEILDAFMLVGSAKPELLGDKDALEEVTEEAMRLQAAAKDIKLNDAVDALTLALNQYGAPAEKAAQYTNVLAAGSKAGAANIASQAASIRVAGTAASSANVSIEQTVGLIETLAYKGIKNEIAGTGLKKFFLTLQTGADETNPKVAGLDKALENLRKKNMSASQVKTLFGEEGYNVASIIMHNTDKVKEFTTAVTDTNVAIEQSAINSSTAAAKLEQAKNQLKIESTKLAEDLEGVFTFSTNSLTYLIKLLPDIIKFFKEYGSVIVLLTASVFAYIAAINIENIRSRALIVTKTTMLVLNNTLKGSLYLLQIGYYLLTGQMAKARGAMVAFNLVTKLNPIGALIAIVTAAAGAFYLLSRRVSAAETAQKRLEDIRHQGIENTQKERTELDNLWKIANDVKVSIDERRKAIKKINDISPEYLSNISLETIKSGEAQKQIDRYNKSLIRKATIQAEVNRLADIDSKMAKYGNDKAEYLKKEINVFKLLWNGFSSGSAIPEWDNWVEEKKKLTADLKKLQEEDLKSIPTKNKIDDDENNDDDLGGSTVEKDKFVKVEEEHYKRLADIKKKYLSDSSMSQEEYNKLIQESELKLLQDKLKVIGVEPEERQKINDQILNMQVKFKDALIAEEKKKEKERSEELKQQQEEEKSDYENYKKDKFSELDKLNQLEIEKNAQKFINGEISQQEYYENLKEIQRSYDDEILADIDASEEQKNEIIKRRNNEAVENAKNNADEQKEILKSQFDALSGLGQEIGESLADFITNTETSLDEFAKNIIKLTLDTLQKVMTAAIAKRTIDNIADLGPIGVVKAAGEIALITAAFETAKNLLSFDTGGFTPSGEWNKPQGVVHSNEFIANRFAVANPNIRPVLNMIDYAQQTGSVANLTSEDIASVVGSRSNSTSNNKQLQNKNISYQFDQSLISVISECSSLMKKVKDRFDRPIVAETYATGKNGTIEATKFIDKMESNVARKNN